MIDHNIQSFVEEQNQAYLFQAKKNTETEISNSHKEIEKILTSWKKEIDIFMNNLSLEAKQHTNNSLLGVQIPCLAEDICTTNDSDYPVGSIISVSVVCSIEEGNSIFMEKGPRVNTILNNVYIRSGKDANTQQAFHWADGNEIQSEFYAKLPGVWRSRGVCGNFNGSVVSCKYYLAQRTA